VSGATRVPLRGEIWLVLTPGRPGDPHQPRPALCVSADVRNRNRDHALFVPVYSRGRPGPTRTVLSRGMGGLAHDSIAFCEEVTTLDYDFLAEGPLGDVVPERVMREAVLAVRRAVGDVVLED
jgi:mRNA-degrading endonuclease toxin of MazEF toxin-antitoxin module